MKHENKSIEYHETNQQDTDDTASVICQKRCAHKTLTLKSIFLLLILLLVGLHKAEGQEINDEGFAIQGNGIARLPQDWVVRYTGGCDNQITFYATRLGSTLYGIGSGTYWQLMPTDPSYPMITGYGTTFTVNASQFPSICTFYHIHVQFQNRQCFNGECCTGFGGIDEFSWGVGLLGDNFVPTLTPPALACYGGKPSITLPGVRNGCTDAKYAIYTTASGGSPIATYPTSTYSQTVQLPAVTATTTYYLGYANLIRTHAYDRATMCTHTKRTPLTVTVRSPLTATITSQNKSCTTNGSISVNATAPYYVSINNGVSYSYYSGTANYTIPNIAAGTYQVKIKDNNNCESVATSVTVANKGTAITFSTTPVNILCKGANSGSITVSASGGDGNYQYSKDNGLSYQASNVFNNLGVGPHLIKVKDGGTCVTATASSVPLSEPALALSYTTTTIDANCNGGGEIHFTTSGGSPPYQYSLDNISWQTTNLVNLMAGNYTVYVKDNNACTANSSSVVVPLNATSSSFTATNITCNGTSNGTITVSTSGGVPPYQYRINGGAWQGPNFTNLGVITNGMIEIEDANECVEQITGVNISQPPALGTPSTTQVDNLCFGGSVGSITVTGSGGTSPYKYQINGGAWQSSNIFQNLATGTYTVAFIDNNNCVSGNTSVTITQGSQIVPEVSNISTASCDFDDGLFSVGAPPWAYHYSINNSDWYAQNTFFNLSAGAHILYVRDANNCRVNAQVVINKELKATGNISYSDGPVSYGTAQHDIVSCLYLGSLNPNKVQIIATPDIMAAAAKNDDGLNGGALAKQGIYTDINHANFKLTSGGQLEIKVSVGNFGSSVANIMAWFDFNRNGVFDTHETSFHETVPVDVIDQDVLLRWPNALNRVKNGISYLRIRITTDAFTNNPTDSYSDGEVEDYRVNLNLHSVDKIAELKNGNTKANVGDTIVYKIKLNNNLPSVTNFQVFDLIPQNTMYVANSAMPASGSYNAVDKKVVWTVNQTANSSANFSFEVIVTDVPTSEEVSNIAYAIREPSMPAINDTANSALHCDLATIDINKIFADDDCAITFVNTTRTSIDIRNNDTDPLQIVIKPANTSIRTQGKHGTASINADGTLQYIPQNGYLGLDSVQYRISTSASNFADAWVRIAIVDPLGEFTACAGSIRIGMKPIPDVTYTWYQLDGTPIATHNDGTDDITINIGTADTVFHVAAIIGTCTTDRLEVKVKKSELVSVPDIRVQVCPQVGFSIDLHSLIDVEYYVKAKFTNSALGLSGTEGTSELLHSTALLTNPGTHKILYTFESLCGTSDAVMYVKTLGSTTHDIRDTVRVCKDFAANIHLKQILGLEVLGGTWASDISLAPIGNYVSVLNGAHVFNGSKAWADGKGTLVDDNRHFVFKYTIPSGNACMPAQDRELVIVLTPDIRQ